MGCWIVSGSRYGSESLLPFFLFFPFFSRCVFLCLRYGISNFWRKPLWKWVFPAHFFLFFFSPFFSRCVFLCLRNRMSNCLYGSGFLFAFLALTFPVVLFHVFETECWIVRKLLREFIFKFLGVVQLYARFFFCVRRIFLYVTSDTGMTKASTKQTKLSQTNHKRRGKKKLKLTNDSEMAKEATLVVCLCYFLFPPFFFSRRAHT